MTRMNYGGATDPIPDYEDIQKVTLKRVLVAAQTYLDAESIDLQADTFYDWKAQELVLMLKAYIYVNDIDKIKYPCDWKQAFKERFAPKWVLRKWPVKYKTYNVSAFYPKLKIPDLGEKTAEIYFKVNV